ncbi:lipocalin family protein [Falsirhodobacter deserti]|uniref:lipocalin family protein n=1 Tax=Falsirhodobacter deserti TaxID=1365611 RepID=UPI000FE2BF13|nr:lipocalin family protein [Falsirhodobacter deserti]
MRWLVLLLAVAACARSAPAPVEVFRDGQVPIYSNAGFDPATLAGTWTQVATFGAACAPGALTFASGRVDGSLCLNGQARRISGPFGITGPSRILPMGEGEPWWILWIDYDRRSMAIGTPSGTLGFVLDRTGAIPPDRMKAAADIFDWNGYDTGRLRPL